MTGNYPSLSVLLTFLVVTLPPRFPFAPVFFNIIMVTMTDIRRPITCVDVGDADVATGIRSS
jgi:hypothetical protein